MQSISWSNLGSPCPLPGVPCGIFVGPKWSVEGLLEAVLAPKRAWAQALVTVAAEIAGSRLTEERINDAGRLLLSLLLREGLLSQGERSKLTTLVDESGDCTGTLQNRGHLKTHRTGNFCVRTETVVCLERGWPHRGQQLGKGSGSFPAVLQEDENSEGREGVGGRPARTRHVPVRASGRNAGQDCAWVIRGSVTGVREVGVSLRHTDRLQRREVARPACTSPRPGVWV